MQSPNLKTYTPSILLSGSSTSHWTPNLEVLCAELYEPSIAEQFETGSKVASLGGVVALVEDEEFEVVLAVSS